MMQKIKGKVLIISESDDISVLVAAILNRSGCQAMAANKMDALRVLTENEFDAVIMDWMTDEDRDLAFCEQILFASSVPIFLFTGVRSGEEVTLALREVSEEQFASMTAKPVLTNSIRATGKAAASK
jgi:DNA-binding response OmpR family regulator